MPEAFTTRWASRLLRTRWLVRTPVLLFRVGLGWVFGTRLLMLEHRGRSSGRVRYAVLEVVDRPVHLSCVVVAGFGDRVQWMRNVRVDPRVRGWVGGHRPVSAIARELSAAESAQALELYATRHPRSWRRLRPVLEETVGASIDPALANLPLVVLEATLR